jgi:hypothetical protein
MRKVFIVLAAIAALGMLAPPAMAQAPAPKVTINGLVDFVTSYHKNVTDIDVTNGGRDHAWYSRERGVFTITGEVGRSKGVWAVELDFTNGAGQATSGAGGSSCRDVRFASAGTSCNVDLDGDVSGAVETKWLYLETPITGPGSLMPFIPVPSIVRAGLQPARGHEYKNGIIFGGDFPGVTVETTWSPTIKSILTFVQVGEGLDLVTAPTQFDNVAWLFSVEAQVFKGLTVKPTIAINDYSSGNCGTANLGTHPKNGFNPNVCGGAASPTAFEATNAVASGLKLQRYTIGGDVRYTRGPLTIQPTFFYQFGSQEIRPVVSAARGDIRRSVDIRAWIFDTIVGYRTGPLNIEGRFMYTPGMAAQHIVQNGSDIGYWQPAVNGAFGYMAGWSEINTSGIDYNNPFLGGVSGAGLRNAPSYDKYGQIFLAGALDYALTPALTFKNVLNVRWTDEEVDTSGVLTAAGLTSPRLRGRRDEERFLGVELNVGFTYRFAPNVAFDLIGAYMWTGAALSHARTGTAGCRDREDSGSPACSADDIIKTAARVRFTF